LLEAPVARYPIGPLPTVVAQALQAHRASSSYRAGALIFRSTRNPKKAASRHTAADWLKRAYRKAGIEKEPGSLWLDVHKNVHTFWNWSK
jgi:hypothetical protein